MAKDKKPAKGSSADAEEKWVAPKYVWEAPADFTPFFLEVKFKTEEDGMLGGTVVATRYKGKYDPRDEDKRKWDLATYDVPTLIALQARLNGVVFHSTGRPAGNGETRRLTPNTLYKLLIRVGSKKADKSLTAGIKAVWRKQWSEKHEKFKVVKLDKEDHEFRRIRKASRHLPVAFKNTIAPPKGVRMKKKKDTSDDE